MEVTGIKGEDEGVRCAAIPRGVAQRGCVAWTVKPGKMAMTALLAPC
jgi:hypothetical protein